MGGVGDSVYDGFAAAVAYGSLYNEYLVVWEGDDNSGGLVDEELEIFGQLLSAAGGGVLVNDFRISDVGGTGSAASRARSPDVAYNSNYHQYFVVWSADDPVDGVVDNEFEIWARCSTPTEAGSSPTTSGSASTAAPVTRPTTPKTRR